MSHLGSVEKVKLEWDEDGLTAIVTTSYDDFSFTLDPQQLWDEVQKEIAPWIAEQVAAQREYELARRGVRSGAHRREAMQSTEGGLA